jgi:hypothetical protein
MNRDKVASVSSSRPRAAQLRRRPLMSSSIRALAVILLGSQHFMRLRTYCGLRKLGYLRMLTRHYSHGHGPYAPSHYACFQA